MTLPLHSVDTSLSENSMPPPSESELKNLLNAETLFRVLEKMPIGIYIANSNGKIVYANQAGQKIWEGIRYVEPDAFSEYKAWWLNNGKRISSEDWALNRAVNLNQQSLDEEIEIECFDGTHKIIQNSAFPLYDEKENVSGGFALNIDITQQKSYLREIEHLAQFPSRNPNPVMQVSRDGYLLYNNPGCVCILNATGYVKGKPLDSTWCALIREVLDSGQVKTIDIQILDRFFSITLAPLHKEDCVNIYGLDITDRKRTESELQKAQKLESLGHLAAGIAHDFNNLLTGIYGYIDLALMDCQGSKVAEYLKTAVETMGQARSITEQLITFAKGGIPDFKEWDLVNCLKKSVERNMSDSAISIHYNISDTIYRCRFDIKQIERVFRTILTNAKEAMRNSGSLTVTISNIDLETAPGKLPPGKYVKVSFQDKGPGIPESIINQIFDPFFTTKELGRGLGLSAAYSIMSRHNGTIEVEQISGNGALFHIYIPAIEEYPVHSEASSSGFGKIRIILMDDEKVVLESTALRLINSGFEVITAPDGQTVISKLRDELQKGSHFDLAILDLTVHGGWGGIETLKEIRKLDTTIPVIVSSGYSDDPTMSSPALFGFSGCIKKPFAINQLLEQIRKLTGSEKQQDSR